MQYIKITLVLITMASADSSWAAMRPHLDLQRLCIEAVDVVECEVGHIGEKGYIESHELLITKVWKGNRKTGGKVAAPSPIYIRFYHRLDANDPGSEITFPVIEKLLIFLDTPDKSDKDPILDNGVIAIDNYGLAYSMSQQLWNPSPYSLIQFGDEGGVHEVEFFQTLKKSLKVASKPGFLDGLQE